MPSPEVLLGEAIEEVGAQCLRPLGIEYDTSGSAAVRQAHELLLSLEANLSRSCLTWTGSIGLA